MCVKVNIWRHVKWYYELHTFEHTQWLHMIVRSRWWHDIPQMENGFCRQQLALRTNFQAELLKVYIENSSKLKWFDIIGWWDDLSLYWFLSNFENRSISYFLVFNNMFDLLFWAISNKQVSFIIVWFQSKWYIPYECNIITWNIPILM